MAWQPCLRCDQRFAGEASNVYLTLFRGDEREAYRFVVCPECLEQLLSEWRMRALYRDDDGDWAYHEPTSEPTPRTSSSEPRERPPRGRRGRRGQPEGDLPW